VAGIVDVTPRALVERGGLAGGAMTRFEFAITAVLGACLATGFAIIALL
jgi:hypothetical protein